MSFTRLRYHIVFATKGRRRFIKPDVEPVIFDAIRAEARKLGGVVIEINGTEDHIHIVVAIPPTVAVSDFLRAIKARSSFFVRKRFPRVGFGWQVGFAAFTVTPFRMEKLVAYVRNQKQHHARGTTVAQFEDWSPADPG